MLPYGEKVLLRNELAVVWKLVDDLETSLGETAKITSTEIERMEAETVASKAKRAELKVRLRQAEKRPFVHES